MWKGKTCQISQNQAVLKKTAIRGSKLTRVQSQEVTHEQEGRKGNEYHSAVVLSTPRIKGTHMVSCGT